MLIPPPPSPSATPPPTPMRLMGARVLRGGELREGEVSLAGGLVEGAAGGRRLEVDLSGYLVLPGIVDLCGGAFERHVSPAPRVALPLEAALLAADREAASWGVTTAHLGQGWSWEGGASDPDRAEALLAALDAHRPRALTDLRAVLRVEAHTVGTADRLVAAMRRHGVRCALLGDRLTGRGLAGGGLVDPASPRAVAARAEALGVPPEEHAARRRAAVARAAEMPRHVLRLAEAFDAMGVAFGSEGCRDAEAREAWSMRGARICAFPLSRAAAASARAVGDPVVLSAPEVAGFAPPRGRVGAADLLEEGLGDALASEEAYPALARAALRLAGEGSLPFARAWALVSERPARILGLSDRGRIEEGLRADLCVLDPVSGAVEATIREGHVSHLASGVAARLLAAAASARAAA